MLNDIKINLAVGDRLYARKWIDENGTLDPLDLVEHTDIDDRLIVEVVGADFIVVREGHYGWPQLIVFDHIPEDLLAEWGYGTQQAYVDALTNYWSKQ